MTDVRNLIAPFHRESFVIQPWNDQGVSEFVSICENPDWNEPACHRQAIAHCAFNPTKFNGKTQSIDRFPKRPPPPIDSGRLFADKRRRNFS
jgi:hypothetical protein